MSNRVELSLSGFSIDDEDAVAACNELTQLVGRELPLLQSFWIASSVPIPPDVTGSIGVFSVVSPSGPRGRIGFNRERPPSGKFQVGRNCSFSFSSDYWQCNIHKTRRDHGWEVSIDVGVKDAYGESVRSDACVTDDLRNVVLGFSHRIAVREGGADGPGQGLTLRCLNGWGIEGPEEEVIHGYRWVVVVPAGLAGLLGSIRIGGVVDELVELTGASAGGLLVRPVLPPEEMSVEQLREWKALFVPVLSKPRDWIQRELYYERGRVLRGGSPPGILPEDWTRHAGVDW